MKKPFKRKKKKPVYERLISPKVVTDTFSKFSFIMAFTLLSFAVLAQDTIPATKVKICNQLVNRKNGKVERNFYSWVKVKKGYIVKEPNGLWIINDKEMKPNSNNVPLTAIK